VRDARTPHLGGADFQGLQRALDGGVRQAPGGAEALTQADRAGEGIDDTKSAIAAIGAGDQEAAVIGAEVDGCIGIAR